MQATIYFILCLCLHHLGPPLLAQLEEKGWRSQVMQKTASNTGDLGWEDPLEKDMVTHSIILFSKFILLAIGVWLLFSIVMVSAIHQHQSAIGIHRSLPSWTSLPPPSMSHLSKLSQSTSFGFLTLYIKFPLANYSTYGNVYVSKLLSQIISPFPSPAVSKICLYSYIFIASLHIGSSVPSF